MSLELEVAQLAAAMMATVIAWHFLLEMIDYAKAPTVLKEIRPASLQHDRDAGPARTGHTEASTTSTRSAS